MRPMIVRLRLMSDSQLQMMGNSAERYGSTVELVNRRSNGLGEGNAEFLIDLKRIPPELTCLTLFCGVGGDVAQPPQCLGLTAPIGEVPGKGQGLGVVLTGLAILTYKPLHLAEPLHRVNFAESVTKVPSEGQGLNMVVTGLVILTNAPLNLAQPRSASTSARQ